MLFFKSREYFWSSVVIAILVPITVVMVGVHIAIYHSNASNRGLSLLNERGNPVAMSIVGSTAHYRINESDTEEEYRRLLPSGGHLVYLQNKDGKFEEYTVTLFHQLKCLDVIRREYLNDQSMPISHLTQHCMNYLRQSLLCNLNTALENAKNSAATASRSYNALCFDWTKVYAEAERNDQVYQESKGR